MSTTLKPSPMPVATESGYYVLFSGRNKTPFTRSIRLGTRGDSAGRLSRAALYILRSLAKEKGVSMYVDGYRKADVMKVVPGKSATKVGGFLVPVEDKRCGW